MLGKIYTMRSFVICSLRQVSKSGSTRCPVNAAYMEVELQPKFCQKEKA